jgi:hypothetical protein
MLTPALLVGTAAAVELPLAGVAAWEEAAAEPLTEEVVLIKEEITVERIAEEAVEIVVLVELEDWIAAT